MSIFDNDSFADMMGGGEPAPAPMAATPAAAPAADAAALGDPFRDSQAADPYGAAAGVASPQPKQGLGAVPAAPAPKPLPAEQLAEATADGEAPPSPEVTAALVAQAAAGTEAEAVAMAAWLAERLTNGMGELTGSIPVTLKTLNALIAMAEGSATFRSAALGSCGAAVAAAQTFDRADPVHGDMPAKAVRATATKLQALLQKKEGMAAMKSGGLSVLKKGKAKAAEAAKLAEEKAKEASCVHKQSSTTNWCRPDGLLACAAKLRRPRRGRPRSSRMRKRGRCRRRRRTAAYWRRCRAPPLARRRARRAPPKACRRRTRRARPSVRR